MKIYLSGKMTGIKNYNFGLFNTIATALFCELEKLKYDVRIINPASISMELGTRLDWSIYLATDLKKLSECDIIVMFGNWQSSEGAKLEHEFARLLGIDIVYSYSHAKTNGKKIISDIFNIVNEVEKKYRLAHF